MIISNSRRFIFVHNYKTAGEAITHALAPHLDWRDVELGSTRYGQRVDGPYRERFGLWKHSRAREVRAVVGDAVWRDYLTFAVVRHPYERARSLHGFLAREAAAQGWRRRLVGLSPRLRRRAPWRWPMMEMWRTTRTFSDFIRHPDFGVAAGTAPQVDLICDADGRTAMVDRVLRFERLSQEFAALCAEIGVEGATLAEKNVSDARAPAARRPGEGLAEADRAVLARVYAADFEVFGYAP